MNRSTIGTYVRRHRLTLSFSAFIALCGVSLPGCPGPSEPAAVTTMSIIVSSAPATGTVAVNATRQFAIEVRTGDQVVAPFTNTVWSIVGTAGIATIAPSGLATCVTPGTVTVHVVGAVSVTVASLSADASLVCFSTGNAATAIVMTPWTATAALNGTVTAAATFIDAGGLPTTNGCPIAFTTDAASTATAVGAGLTATVTGRAAGTTGLRATCATGGTLASIARLQVTSAPLNVARIVMVTRYVRFPASTTTTTFPYLTTAQDATGATISGAPIVYTISGGSAATIDQAGTVTVTASTGPTFRGGAVLTATSGGQTEIGFLTYGDAGAIRGQLTSMLGQYLRGTTASATNTATGEVTAAGGITNDGYFYIVGLIAGTYTVTATGPLSGQVQTFTNVVVTSGNQTVVTPTAFASTIGG